MRKGGTASREAIYKVFCSHRRTRLRTLCHAQQHKHPREDLFLAPLKEEKTKVVLLHVFSITGRTTRGKKACVPWEKVYIIIGVHWRDISRFCVRIQSNIFQSSHIIVMNALFAEPGDPRNALEHIEERLSHGRTTCCQWCEKRQFLRDDDDAFLLLVLLLSFGVFLSFP